MKMSPLYPQCWLLIHFENMPRNEKHWHCFWCLGNDFQLHKMKTIRGQCVANSKNSVNGVACEKKANTFRTSKRQRSLCLFVFFPFSSVGLTMCFLIFLCSLPLFGLRGNEFSFFFVVALSCLHVLCEFDFVGVTF